jgi:leader peptidase (prepilin peptidase)/N-methyltransferase
MEYWQPLLAVFVLGCCIGSFLNVCIHRLPIEESVVSPGSHCPVCREPIHFYDNLPLLSYLLLGGRCRRCRTVIPWRYPLVELLAGLLALALWARFGWVAATGTYFLFSAALLVITFIDLDHQIIPDKITLPGIPLFGFAALLFLDRTWQEVLLGILAGGGSLWGVAWVYSRITGKEGMGGGDIKLLAMIGALLGWQGVLFTIFAASALGTVIGLALMLHARGSMKMAIPFGPFLAVGALTYLFFGPHLVGLYLGLLR